MKPYPKGPPKPPTSQEISEFLSANPRGKFAKHISPKKSFKEVNQETDLVTLEVIRSELARLDLAYDDVFLFFQTHKAHISRLKPAWRHQLQASLRTIQFCIDEAKRIRRHVEDESSNEQLEWLKDQEARAMAQLETAKAKLAKEKRRRL